MRHLALILLWLFAGLPAQANGEQSGAFDYYVMALSWSPDWCALTGDGRHDPQCDPGRGLTFILHGLWPQYDAGGYPSDCHSSSPDPSRSATGAMADIMSSSGLAFHEWQKHGRCSGLSSADYYTAMRKALKRITIPPLFAKVSHDLQVAPHVVEDAFLEANPQLNASQITVTCDQGLIQEVRICLTKDLIPRPCAPDAARECSLSQAGLDAVR